MGDQHRGDASLDRRALARAARIVAPFATLGFLMGPGALVAYYFTTSWRTTLYVATRSGAYEGGNLADFVMGLLALSFYAAGVLVGVLLTLQRTSGDRTR